MIGGAIVLTNGCKLSTAYRHITFFSCIFFLFQSLSFEFDMTGLLNMLYTQPLTTKLT